MQAANTIRRFFDTLRRGDTFPPHPLCQNYIHVKEQEIKKHLKHLVNYLIFPRKLSDQRGPLPARLFLHGLVVAQASLGK